MTKNEYAAEAEERWGDTEAYRQSQERTGRYTQDDWTQIKAEASAIEEELATALRAGRPVDSDEVTGLAERHRQHISRWYYDCSYETQIALGDMYVDDPRFTAHYEAVASGLAAYLRDAIRANAAAR